MARRENTRKALLKGLIPVYKRKKQIINIIISDYIYFCENLKVFEAKKDTFRKTYHEISAGYPQ